MIKKLSVLFLFACIFSTASISDPLSFREAKTHMPGIFSKLKDAKPSIVVAILFSMKMATDQIWNHVDIK